MSLMNEKQKDIEDVLQDWATLDIDAKQAFAEQHGIEFYGQAKHSTREKILVVLIWLGTFLLSYALLFALLFWALSWANHNEIRDELERQQQIVPPVSSTGPDTIDSSLVDWNAYDVFHVKRPNE